MANRVHSKGPFRHEEFVASEAGIYPGMLVTINSSNQAVIHTTEGGVLGDECIIAAEDALQGNTIATVYAILAIVSCVIANKGSVVNVLLEDGQNAAIGNKLISAGNGKFKVSTDLESGETLAHVQGIADEALDLTGSNTSDTLVAMRVV